MPNDHRRGLFWALGSTLGIAGMIIPWKLVNTLDNVT